MFLKNPVFVGDRGYNTTALDNILYCFILTKATVGSKLEKSAKRMKPIIKLANMMVLDGL